MFLSKNKTMKGMYNKMRVMVAAAGTAGHINPAISIANKIKQEEKDSEIIFIRYNKRFRK